MSHIWSVPGIEFQPFDEIEEERPVILVTTQGEWESVESDLKQLQLTQSINIQSASAPRWMELTAALLAKKPSLDNPVIYAVGGGLAVDAAKYLSHHSNLPLYSLPTALSEDTFFTWASGVRHDGGVTYLETRPPDKVVIDFDVISAAPKQIRASGICDVLSIATALWDWEYAEELDKNPEGLELIPWAADAAQAVLQGSLDCAEAAGAGDPAGLKQLLDCLILEVQLCNLIGHSRPKEGSEHYFAYAVENHINQPLSHGNLLGHGIMLIAKKQDQDVEELRYALEACHIPLNNISPDLISKTYLALPKYVRKHELPYGIAHQKSDE